MANLGTLWFGADIDLTRLQQKINQGNQGILNALKMDYDPQSYSMMVSKLRSALSRETFEIKVTTNTQRAIQNVQNATRGIGGAGTMTGLDAMNDKILRQQNLVSYLTAQVKAYQVEWQKLGGTDRKNRWRDSEKELAREKANLSYMLNERKAMREATKDTLQNLRLEAAMQRKATREATQELAQRRQAVREYNKEHIRLNSTLAGGIHVSTQLGSALSSLFAIDAARQFLGNVIEIGGQLEKQRISIGAILGDTVKAGHLFEQIKGLALQSPFGVVELDQYTKQLSAYGFRYNELFDMTKRLADISAGAGTDIGRLTLALGHVRSATYLTGITLRQFSMNNIPMLKMLADYYTEVEKKAVSTAEVQKRISKRQVSYEDVIEQIRRLTDEGGMFYNMQEKISSSLAARYKNLKDAMDIMYGEMAEGKVGDMLKGVASVLLQTTRHWKEIAAALAVAAGAFAISKMRIGMQTVALQGNTAATVRKLMVDKQLYANQLRMATTYRTLTAQERIAVMSANSLTVADIRLAMAAGQLTKEEVLRLVALKQLKVAQAMHLVGVNGITAAEIKAAAAAKSWRVQLAGMTASLKNAFMGIGPGTWATLGVMVGTELYMAYNQWVGRIDDKSKEMKDLIKSRINDLEKMQKTLTKENKPTDQTALKGRVDEMKQVLANSEAYTKTLDEQVGKAGSLSEKYDILADAIDNAADKNQRMLDYQDQIAEMIKSSSTRAKDFKQFLKAMVISDDDLDFGDALDFFFNDGIGKNMSQTLDAYKEFRTVIDGAWEYKDAISGVIEEMLESEKVSEGFKEQLREAPFEEQIRLLAENGYWDMLKSKVASIRPDFLNFAEHIKQASNGVTERWSEIASDDIPRMLKDVAKQRHISEQELSKWCLENIDDFKMMLDGINDQLGIKEPAIRKRMKRLFYDYVRFSALGSTQVAAGSNAIGDVMGSVFGDESLKRLLEENDIADLKDDSSSSSKNGTGSKDKKDEQLEAARTKLAEYKAFLSEYKKYREMYSKERAIDLLESLFPNLKGQGLMIVDNFIDVLGNLANSLDATTEARKKFVTEVEKTKADTQFDREKESMKKSVEAMEEYVKRTEEQWKLYRSLFEKSGGNKEFAELAFNDTGAIWDVTAKKMLERFNQLGNELGVMPINFSWNMNEHEMKDALVDANGKVREELVKLAMEIQKVIYGNYSNFLKDSADAYNKSLTQTEKLVALEEQLKQKVKERNEYNGDDEAIQKGFEAQIKNLKKQIAGQKWEAFKETEQWGVIFSNLDNVTTQTLSNMHDKLLALVPSVQENVEGIKALYEAIDKIKSEMDSRNPFSAIFDSMQRASRLRRLLDMSNWGANGSGTFTPIAASAKYYGLAAGRKYTREQLKGILRGMEGDLPKGLEALANKFKAVQDVLQPVIDLFEMLGDEGMSMFFQTGNNALGAAAQAASGMNALGLGSMGPYGAAAAAALSLVSAAFAEHDASIQKEIEASEARQKEMENLTKNLENALSRTLGGIYQTRATDKMISSLEKGLKKTFSTLTAKFTEDFASEETKTAIEKAKETKSYYDATYASLLAQRDELIYQMNMEEKKKKADSSKIADYNQQLEEINDEINNFAIDVANSIYDIDIKSWSSELGDALYEAWQKGEDGAEAFRKKSTEIIAELSKKIAVTKLIETAMKPVLEMVESEMARTGGKLDEISVERIASEMEAVGNILPNSFNALMDGLNEGAKKAGIDFKSLVEDSESTSSSMASGIKSITEQTADLLASYINAIRADVSVMREMETVDLPAITLSVQEISVLTQTQVQLQTQIAENTRMNAEATAEIERMLSQATRDPSFAFHVR